ncbi:GMP synthase [Sarocladium implicatum]|nr:GMP synthase [Sarocladium implicatum]
MSKFSSVMKNGWHPEGSKGNSSSSSSSGGGGGGKSLTGLGLRNKTNSMMGGKSQEDTDRSNHVSAPLSSLKDPASFAPPPRRTGTGLAPAPPPSNTPRKVIAAPSTYHDPRSSAPLQPPPKISSVSQLEQEQQAPPPRSGPYTANTTGLSTAGLPAPPKRRDSPASPASPAPPSYEAATGAPRPVPSLPPRLPARTNTGGSTASSVAAPAPTSGGGMLNQGAVNRLGAAGVSVPALGINRSANTTASPSPPPPPRPAVGPAQVNSLQNRFAKLGTSTTGAAAASPTAPSAPPAEGTTWQQKQAALRTASNFQKDPSSVSLSDARSAAGTANNFRQRHGEQVAAGWRGANNLNQKYGVADKVGGLAGQAQGSGGEQPQPPHSPAAGAMAALAGGKKKPPPPPPKKKPGLSPAQTPTGEDAPPPIPTSTRPQF